MITPAYGLTATERVLPRLALDFTTASLDARVTVTRALNTATRVNSSGFIEAVNANLPRFDFSPTSVGVCRGLLIEESRANSLTNSNTFTDSVVWTQLNATVEDNAAVSPDGTQNADKLVETIASGNHRLGQTLTVSTGTSYTFSIFNKVAGRDRTSLLVSGASGGAFFNFNLSTALTISSGTFGSGYTLSNPTFQVYPDGWYRVIMTITSATDTSLLFSFQPLNDANNNVYVGDITKGLYAYGAQVEAGDFATSYIPTTTTSLTRNADAVSMTGTNFSDWYNATEGALAVQVIAEKTIANNTRAAVVSDATNRTIDINIQNGGWLTYNGSTNIVPVGNVATIGATVNILARYASGNYAIAMNGNEVVKNATTTVYPATTLWIGTNRVASVFLNGYVRKISYWPLSVTDAEVQSFSK